MAETHPANERHETRDVDRPALLIFAAAFAGFIALALGVMWLIFVAGAGAGGFAAVQPRTPDPDGLLELRNARTLYESAQRQALVTGGWTDATHAYARLPIAQAMKLLADKGLTLSATPDTTDCPVVGEASPRAASVTGCGAAP